MEKQNKRREVMRTPMLKRYLIKFVFRLVIFVPIAFFYIKDKALMYEVMTDALVWKIAPIHVLWLVFMVMMLKHIFPTETLSMALRKTIKKKYDEQDNYSDRDLLHFIQDQNQRALVVMLIWLSFNAVFGILYLMNIIGDVDLLMLTVLYFLCDYICILFFCPFQTFIMKNRCCVNCRIYDWGHFMMFTPMLFIRNFFSWSLFFISCVVLLKWEIIYIRHPERFWSGSNRNLQCANCKDRTCQFKKSVKAAKDAYIKSEEK